MDQAPEEVGLQLLQRAPTRSLGRLGRRWHPQEEATSPDTRRLRGVWALGPQHGGICLLTLSFTRASFFPPWGG